MVNVSTSQKDALTLRKPFALLVSFFSMSDLEGSSEVPDITVKILSLFLSGGRGLPVPLSLPARVWGPILVNAEACSRETTMDEASHCSPENKPQ